MACHGTWNNLSYLVDHPGPLILLQPRLHLGERTEHRLGFLDLFFLVPEEFQRLLKHLSRLGEVPSFLLKLSPLYPNSRLRTHSNPSLVDRTRPVVLLVPHFHLDVSLPSLVIRFPLHPSLEHLAGAWHILEEFFEVYVFVPQLIDSREEGHGAIEEVSSVLNISRF